VVVDGIMEASFSNMDIHNQHNCHSCAMKPNEGRIGHCWTRLTTFIYTYATEGVGSGKRNHSKLLRYVADGTAPPQLVEPSGCSEIQRESLRAHATIRESPKQRRVHY
jgi:hypothetical protein